MYIKANFRFKKFIVIPSTKVGLRIRVVLRFSAITFTIYKTVQDIRSGSFRLEHSTELID